MAVSVLYTLFLLLMQTYFHTQGYASASMDRHDDKEHHDGREHDRSASPGVDEDTFSAKGSSSPERNSSGHSGGPIEIHDEKRKPPAEQPLDFSLKSRAASSCCSSPTSSEEDRRMSPPNHSVFSVAPSNLLRPLPWNAPEIHHPNPLVVTPSTSTAAISTPPPEIPFKVNGYSNGFGTFCDSIMPFMPSLPSPPACGLFDNAPAPPLVRPPPSQQAAFPSMSLLPPATTQGSPPSSVSPTTPKYVRPFKAYQRGERLSLGICGITGSYLPSAATALAPGFAIADPSLDPKFAAFREHCLRDGTRNGRHDAHRRSKTTPVPASATCQTDTSSHPSLGNGNVTRRPDSGDDGDRTSPDNSNSSTATVTNGVESAAKESNGEATRNGRGALCNGAADGSSPPNGDATSSCGPIRNGRRRSRLPDNEKDSAYWERRRKNNEAAKRSRDARRAKEDEIALRAAYLETQNAQLLYELAKTRAELTLLRQALCAAVSNQQHQ